jgi:uncharacterized protein (UPF0332 family)
MNYSELQNSGLIHPYHGSKKQVQEHLKLAERDIKTSQKIIAEDWDWAFSIAYNAILQAGRTLMFYKGYRPTSGEGAHLAVVQFAEVTFGETFENEISLFDKMRRKRHKVIYDVAGIISQHEARQAFKFAKKFVRIIKEYIEKGKK